MAIKKHPIVVATWARSGTRHWGDGIQGNLDTCSSTRLSLRTAKPRNDWNNDYDSAVSDLCVNIWFDETQVNIDIVAHQVYGKKECDLGYLLKTLKTLRRKVAKSFQLDQFVSGKPIVTLIQFFKALGVQKTVKYPEGYSSVEYEYGDILDLCEKLADHIAYTRASFKKREAA